MRFKKLLPLIIIISIISSCSRNISTEPGVTSVSPSPVITSQSTSLPNVEDVTGEKPDDFSGNLVGISREEAGLSTIEPLDFEKFSLNKRLGELLNNIELYRNDDYKSGIVLDSVREENILLCERYKDNIINDLKIGSDISYVRKILGEPNITEDEDLFIYKTKEYYLGFKGSSKVEYAVLVKRYTSNYGDLLERIIRKLDTVLENSLAAMFDSNEDLESFFDEMGHVHGGGFYADLYGGMYIEDFDTKTITVYNNYEGNLYSVNGFKYSIMYDNSDYQVHYIEGTIARYLSDNEEFETSGVLSPSGKLKSIYFWGYSMLHYFKIRTLDHSRPDFKIHVPAGDYRWLTDDYILYIDAWFMEPYIVRVSEDKSEGIDILLNLGVYEENDPNKPNFSFEIKEVKGNAITLYDKESDKEYKIEYSIGNNGIELKMAG